MKKSLPQIPSKIPHSSILNIANITYCIYYAKMAALLVNLSSGMSLDKIKVVEFQESDVIYFKF